MFNLMLLLPLVGTCVAVWGKVRHNRTTMWFGVAMIVVFLGLGLIDRLLAG